jgi:hypothetical protein
MLSRNACTQDGAIALPGSKDAKVTKERASREKSQEDQPKDYAAAHLAALMVRRSEFSPRHLQQGFQRRFRARPWSQRRRRND